MSYAMYLDDKRDPESDKFAVICRTYQEAVAYVESHGFPLLVSFDHDLGLMSEGSGKDFANWLIDRDLDHGDMPAGFTFFVHSANPVGAENIRSIMTEYLDFKRENPV